MDEIAYQKYKHAMLRLWLLRQDFTEIPILQEDSHWGCNNPFCREICCSVDSALVHLRQHKPEMFIKEEDAVCSLLKLKTKRAKAGAGGSS